MVFTNMVNVPKDINDNSMNRFIVKAPQIEGFVKLESKRRIYK